MSTLNQPTMTLFNLTRDINGYNGFGLLFSNRNFIGIVEEDTPQSITVPTDYEYCIAIFSYESGTSVYVANNDTAEIPTGSFSSTTSQQNPAARLVKSGDVLSITTSSTTAEVGVYFYGIT